MIWLSINAVVHTICMHHSVCEPTFACLLVIFLRERTLVSFHCSSAWIAGSVASCCELAFFQLEQREGIGGQDSFQLHLLFYFILDCLFHRALHHTLFFLSMSLTLDHSFLSSKHAWEGKGTEVQRHSEKKNNTENCMWTPLIPSRKMGKIEKSKGSILKVAIISQF